MHYLRSVSATGSLHPVSVSLCMFAKCENGAWSMRSTQEMVTSIHIGSHRQTVFFKKWQNQKVCLHCRCTIELELKQAKEQATIVITMIPGQCGAERGPGACSTRPGRAVLHTLVTEPPCLSSRNSALSKSMHQGRLESSG